jgi:hypothetical protein
MGSTHTGRFQDYKGDGKEVPDKCKEIVKTILEEVSNSQFYQNNGKLPEIDEQLHISVGKRVAAVADSGEIVGYLPTEYNYLKFCIDEGYLYLGKITQSLIEPLPRVQVIISPQDSE